MSWRPWRNRIYISGGTPCKIPVVTIRLWIGPKFEHMYFSGLIDWVIGITGEYSWTKGQRNICGGTPWKFLLVIIIQVYWFISHIGSLLELTLSYLPLSYWKHNPLGSLLDFLLSYFGNNSHLTTSPLGPILENNYCVIIVLVKLCLGVLEGI